MTSITRIEPIQRYHSTHHIRCVTAAALFDGHDASINIIRRLLQSSGAEVIHLGHNRSVRDVVEAALQEDVQAIAISSYQGGHMEYFRYLRELLNERGGRHIQVFGGGGGVIVPDEIAELERDGIARIFSPEHGRQMGLQGMINSMLESADFNTCPELNGHLQHLNDFHRLARAITFVENHGHTNNIGLPALDTTQRSTPIIGITGPGGAGKSSLTDELCLRFLEENPDMRLAILAVDPTRRKTGGALLGDRIRMNAPALFPDRIFMRSLATRDTGRS
ncbi:MAG: cobalamin-dependent protein, partial [Leptospiraceae bacterium]|nr:cobalamin-dependent protein [Leptospiraceae bacterium]